MDSVFLITISAFILAVILIIITIVIIKSNQNKKYKKEIEELASKKAKIVGALSQSGAYIQELTKQKEQYEAQLISDSEYITAPVSGVVSYRVDGLEDALSTNDLSNLTEEKLENLGLKTGKIISTSQEARKNNK